MSACADVGKFHFTSSKARYFTMCGSTLFHVLQKQNISLYAFVSSNAVLVKKKGRGIFAILRPFPVGRCFDFYTALSQIHLRELFYFKMFLLNLGVVIRTCLFCRPRSCCSKARARLRYRNPLYTHPFCPAHRSTLEYRRNKPSVRPHQT